jgi:hypothetical protein
MSWEIAYGVGALVLLGALIFGMVQYQAQPRQRPYHRKGDQGGVRRSSHLPAKAPGVAEGASTLIAAV